MPLLRMWWHWHNHLHRDEFKENVSQPAQQESPYILNTSPGDETAGHVPHTSSSLTGDCAVVGESVYGADERISTGTYAIPSQTSGLFYAVMRHLAEAKRCFRKRGCGRSRCCCCSPVVSMQRCCFPFVWNSLDFRAVVLLGFTMVSMLTWFGSLDAAPAGPLLKDTALSLSRSVFLHGGEKKSQSVCLEKRVKWLHSVSSSDSFISKPGARQEVPLRGVFIQTWYIVYSVSIRASIPMLL